MYRQAPSVRVVLEIGTRNTLFTKVGRLHKNLPMGSNRQVHSELQIPEARVGAEPIKPPVTFDVNQKTRPLLYGFSSCFCLVCVRFAALILESRSLEGYACNLSHFRVFFKECFPGQQEVLASVLRKTRASEVGANRLSHIKSSTTQNGKPFPRLLSYSPTSLRFLQGSNRS